MQVLFEQSAPAPRHVFLLRPCKLVATHLLHLIVCHLNSTRVLDEGRVIKLPVTRAPWQHFTAPGSSCDRSRFDPALVASCGSRCARAAELRRHRLSPQSFRRKGWKLWLICTSEGNFSSLRETDGFRLALRPELDLGAHLTPAETFRCSASFS